VGGVSDQEWVRGSDDVVRQHLTAQLSRAQQASSPIEALGATQNDDLRKVFLAITKAYHPNRFARRPEDIRRLASEVFILLKDAYDKSSKVSNSERLAEAKATAAAAGKNKATRARSASSRPPDTSAARQEMLNRRRSQLKNRLGGAAAKGSGKRTAQVRAATNAAANVAGEAARQAEDEKKFERAQNLMRRNDFVAAATAFKELAVGRPADKRYRMHMHYAQGRVQQAMGQVDEARAEYKRALSLDPNFAAAHQAMSSLPGENKKKNILGKFFGNK
jgi:tetratricopeptide (TPR) repeat protein